MDFVPVSRGSRAAVANADRPEIGFDGKSEVKGVT